MFFSNAFLNAIMDFRGVLDGFWEGFGTFLASPGELLALFFYDFVAHRAQEAAKRPLSLDLGRVWMDSMCCARTAALHCGNEKQKVTASKAFLQQLLHHVQKCP